MTPALTAPERPRVGLEALRLDGLIGCGGQASVELVYWGAQRLYLKRPLPHLTAEQRRDALEAERVALGALDAGAEPHERRLVATLNTPDGSLTGLLLRPLDGATLSQLSRHGPSWRPHEVVHLFYLITQALERAWEVGLLGHGDLSLANMIIGRTGGLSVLDWAHPQRRELWIADQRALASLLFTLTTGQRLTQATDTPDEGTLVRAGWPRDWASLTAQLGAGEVSQGELTSQARALWSLPLSLEPRGSQSALLLRARQALIARVDDWVSASA